MSTLLPILDGVPQGSILGPLLFIIYVNDLCTVSTLNIKLFADDTCLFYATKSIKDIKQIINDEVKKIDYWMKSNKLTINYSKTKFMLFTNTIVTNFDIFMDNNLIQRVHKIKYLVVYFDSKLT